MATTAFVNCTLLDCTGADPAPRSTVVVQDSRITAVGRARELPVPRDATVIDCGARTLMPGLTDAHIHAAIIETDMAKAQRDSPATFALRVKDVLEQTLDAGFTTVRDAFGLDWGFVQATERGYVKGPRILFVGGCLTADRRSRRLARAVPCRTTPSRDCTGWSPRRGSVTRRDEMRRAARDMLRIGAHGIKLMAGGGCMSPTDEIEHTQFTVEEMAAACYEARTVGKIAMAHVYTPDGIINAVPPACAASSTATFIDEAAAACMRNAGAYFVPTLTTYFLISAHGGAQRTFRRA